LIVASDAVDEENPERRRGRELGIPIVSYFEMLGRLMSQRLGVAVAGTHGKSTTTAMLGEVLTAAGHDPTIVYGAAPLGCPAGARAGGGPLMLAEACEYRANFLKLPARHAAILGIEPDHFDCYDSLDDLHGAFARFAESIPGDGFLLARAGCPATERVTAGLACRVETFGFARRADWQARPLGSRGGRFDFAVVRRGERWADVRLRVPGRHNVLNALAAAALAAQHGVGPHEIAHALGQFRGIQRRLEVRGTLLGVTWVDDYAHHPTEVAAALDTVRRMFPGRRVWAVFQPHQASRTERLLDELASSIQNADKVVVCEVFRARERGPSSGASLAWQLARAARALGADVADVRCDAEVVPLLARHLRPGDVLVTMGAGDIRKIGDGFTDRLREDRAAG
jgi:UDP-N-acetylmuramate--alanine ligase